MMQKRILAIVLALLVASPALSQTRPVSAMKSGATSTGESKTILVTALGALVASTGTTVGLQRPVSELFAGATSDGTSVTVLVDQDGSIVISNGITGTCADTQVVFGTGAQTFGCDAGFTYNSTTDTVTLLGDVIVADEAYGAGWNGDLSAPTKNSVYDKIETLVTAGTGANTQCAYWTSATTIAGDAGCTYVAATDTMTVGATVVSNAGAASTPPSTLTGTWFTGGSATTTKPQLLIEPTGTTSTGWSTSGTGLGVNAASGFAGNLIDLQVAGSSKFVVTGGGLVGIGVADPAATLHVVGTNGAIQIADSHTNTTTKLFRLGVTHYTNAEEPAAGLFLQSSSGNNSLNIGGGTSLFNAATIVSIWTAANNTTTTGTERVRIDSAGNFGLGTSTFGTSAQKVFALFNGTVPSTSPADTVQLFSTDISAGNASLGMRTEQAVVADAAAVSTHSLPVTLNGTIYHILLRTP